MTEWILPVNGIDLWLAQQGSGPPVVLVSGGPGFCDYLEPVADMLDDRCTVYRYDSRGTGRSTVRGPYDVSTLVNDLEGLRVALGHDRWIALGHSFGANLGLAYALEHPNRLQALVYLSGTSMQDDRQWHAAYEAGREAGLDDMPPFAFPPNYEANRLANESWKAYIKAPSLLRQVSELRVPILALCGQRDIRPDWPVRQLAELLPDARFESIPDAGHCPWLTHGTELREILNAWVETAGRGDMGHPLAETRQ